MYRFEATRGAEGEFDAAVELLAVADIYDALTAPKIYKGSPWRIVGALAELMRLPYGQTGRRPVFAAFAELMTPAGAAIQADSKPALMGGSCVLSLRFDGKETCVQPRSFHEPTPSGWTRFRSPANAEFRFQGRSRESRGHTSFPGHIPQ